MTKSAKSSNEAPPYSISDLIAVLVGMAGLTIVVRTLLPLLQVAIPALVGWWLWRHVRRRYQNHQDTLNSLFYQLLQEHQGRITVLDFALTAKLSAIAARQYLDGKAKEFCGNFEVTDQGDIIYVFTTLKGLMNARID